MVDNNNKFYSTYNVRTNAKVRTLRVRTIIRSPYFNLKFNLRTLHKNQKIYLLTANKNRSIYSLMQIVLYHPNCVHIKWSCANTFDFEKFSMHCYNRCSYFIANLPHPISFHSISFILFLVLLKPLPWSLRPPLNGVTYV